MAKLKQPDKLSQDAMAARRAGMSYGKWKGLQSPVKIVKPVIPDGWKICEYCGKAYKPKTNRPQKYCDSVCGAMGYRESKQA